MQVENLGKKFKKFNLFFGLELNLNFEDAIHWSKSISTKMLSVGLGALEKAIHITVV